MDEIRILLASIAVVFLWTVSLRVVKEHNTGTSDALGGYAIATIGPLLLGIVLIWR